MFIELYENKGTYAVKAEYLDLPDFGEDLYRIFSEYGFTFHKTHKKFPELYGIWTSGKKAYISNLMIELHEFYREEIPESIKTVITSLKETERIRRGLDKDLLMSDPKGEFQLEGIRNGISKNRYMFAWEMGMGKSYTIISVLNHRMKYDDVDRVLVLCPLESVYNFREEMLMFSSENLTPEDFYVVTTVNRDPFNSDSKVVICTYRRFLMIFEDEYKRVKKTKVPPSRPMKPIFDLSKWGSNRFLIMDESHELKNKSAKQTRVVKLQSEFFKYRYMLTGTPAPNGIEDYYSQLDILDPTIIGKPYQSFVEDIAEVGTKYSEYAIAGYIPEKIKEFEKQISPWVSRKLSEGNLDLPPFLVKPIYCDLVGEHKKLYQEMVVGTFSTIKKDTGEIKSTDVKNKFPFIMQALDNPSMLKGKISHELSPAIYNTIKKWKFENHVKIPVLDSLLERHTRHGEKIIVWSGHPDTIDQLQKRYGKKYQSIAIHGQSDISGFSDVAEFRNSQLKTFREDPRCKVLFGSYFVLSTAINLVESTISIYMDLPTDFVPYKQSSKRNHRIGQEKRVIAYHLVIKFTADETNYKSLLNGKGLRNEVFLNKRHSLPLDAWKKVFTGELLEGEYNVAERPTRVRVGK